MLTIALEPEAAAIFVKHLPVDRRFDGEGGDLFKTFAPGSKYIVVDAGGMYAERDLATARGSALATSHCFKIPLFQYTSGSFFFWGGWECGIGSSCPSLQLIRPLSTSKNLRWPIAAVSLH